MNLARLARLRDQYRSALLDDVVPFWLRHSLDHEQGGYLTLLDRDGSLYGTDKPVWLQGREIWLFATLYADVEKRTEWLAAAELGLRFLETHCFDESGKMYFAVTREGRPLRMRRYVFSEVFACLAYAAMYRATGAGRYRERAAEMFARFLRYLRTPGLAAAKVDPRTRPMKGLSPLMCLLNMAETLARCGIDSAPSVLGSPPAKIETVLEDTIAEILRDFVKPQQNCVLETVAPDGAAVDGPDGRVMNPGHAIECAWFMLETAQRRGRPDLVASALSIARMSLERGWDATYGGLLYFVDVAGKPATQLEHDMKLWWPHNEALIATLMLHQMTGDAEMERWFEKLHEWTFAHFPDAQHGEWYGYLHRDGSVSTPIKGGMWKGAFHVPRGLLYCWKMLEKAAG